MPHRGHSPRSVVAHFHAFHARAAELLGDVAGIHGYHRVPAHKGKPLLPEAPVHALREAVPSKPTRNLLLKALFRGDAVWNGVGDVCHKRASRAHDGGEQSLRRLLGDLAHAAEDVREKLP